jgi:curved DNA-binding protein
MNAEAGAEEKFKEVAEAYEVLKDSNRRAEYDELRKYGGASPNDFQPPPGWSSRSSGFDGMHSDGNFSDFFHSVFNDRGHNTGQSHSQTDAHSEHFAFKGQDAELEVPIFLEDTFSDESKMIQFSIPSIEGGQVKQVKKTLTDGERIRLKGQGGVGHGKGPNGDLYLHIRLVPHPLFDVEAHNLIIAVPVAPWEAALGAKITVPTLSGKISLNIQPNSQTGQKLRIKGKGLKNKSGSGDMIAVLKVVMPAKSTDEDTLLWQQLAKTHTFDPRTEWGN